MEQLKLYIKELEMKLEARDKVIAVYECMVDKFDSNLKLSIQSNCPSNKNLATQKVITHKLFETVKNNLKLINDDTIINLLEEPHPAINNCSKLLCKALQNDKEHHGQLIIVTTSTFCKYLNDSGELILGNISDIFDKVCALVYERCKPTIIELCNNTFDQLNEDDISENDYTKDNHRYNNIMMLHNQKFKNKMLKEITPMFK
jgi:hypothetical protein